MGIFNAFQKESFFFINHSKNPHSKKKQNYSNFYTRELVVIFKTERFVEWNA